jgi:hypothetical protein
MNKDLEDLEKKLNKNVDDAFRPIEITLWILLGISLFAEYNKEPVISEVKQPQAIVYLEVIKQSKEEPIIEELKVLRKIV